MPQHLINGPNAWQAEDCSSSTKAGNLEPIAIIGMSCRLPGSATDPQKLWELLKQGGSTWSKAPKDRFNQEAFHDLSANAKPGTVCTLAGESCYRVVRLMTRGRPARMAVTSCKMISKPLTRPFSELARLRRMWVTLLPHVLIPHW